MARQWKGGSWSQVRKHSLSTKTSRWEREHGNSLSTSWIELGTKRISITEKNSEEIDINLHSNLCYLPEQGALSQCLFFFFFTDPILAFPQLRLWKRERKQCRILSLFLLSSAWEVLKNFDKSRKTDKSCSYLWLNDNFMQAIVAKTFPYILWIKTHNKSEIDYRWENWVYFPSWKTIGSLTALCPDQKLGMLRDQKRTHF